MARPRPNPNRDWPAILDGVCEWLSAGKTIRAFCRQEGMPGFEEVYSWLALQSDEVRSRIVRARAEGCEAIAEEVVAIADDSSDDAIVDENGNERVNSEFVQRSKLRVETRLRLMSKWNSGRYGDRQTVEHAGGVSVSVVTGVPDATKPAT